MLRLLFQKIRGVFIFLKAIRTGIMGIAVVAGGWIFVAPPTSTEIDLLGISTTPSVAETKILRTQRSAKLLSIVATDRMYNLIASQSEEGVTADDVRTGIEIAAEGYAIVPPSRTTDIDEIQKAATRPSGAKFVSARTTQ